MSPPKWREIKEQNFCHLSIPRNDRQLKQIIHTIRHQRPTFESNHNSDSNPYYKMYLSQQNAARNIMPHHGLVSQVILPLELSPLSFGRTLVLFVESWPPSATVTGLEHVPISRSVMLQTLITSNCYMITRLHGHLPLATGTMAV